MDDINLLEAVERYINGQMNPDERVWFEGLRKSNPEIDQLVVEHTFFLQQLHRFDETRRLKGMLNDLHLDLSEKGAIESPRLQGRARIVHLFNRYKRTGAIAASIAGLTAVAISALVWAVSPATKASGEVTKLSREISSLRQHNREQDKEINKVKNVVSNGIPTADPIVYKTGGTGFLADVRGYVVTSAHVVKGAANIAVQSNAGNEYTARVVFTDELRDLAILKIDDESYKAPAALPYTLRRGDAEIAEPVFTLGFPRNDIVYGEGYLSARTGYKGDTLSCQIGITANRGNSGGPILNHNGEVIGVLQEKQTTAEGVVFATRSKYVYQALTQLAQSDTSFKRVKGSNTNALRGLGRQQQVKKMQDFVYMVKVS